MCSHVSSFLKASAICQRSRQCREMVQNVCVCAQWKDIHVGIIESDFDEYENDLAITKIALRFTP